MFGRIANLFKGFLSLFVSGVERRNPEALLELEQENLRKQIGNFNQGLASHAGLSERLMSQAASSSRAAATCGPRPPRTYVPATTPPPASTPCACRASKRSSRRIARNSSRPRPLTRTW